MMGIPQEELVMVSDEAAELAANFNDGVSQDSPKKWRKGELEFEAEMRRLDNAVSNLLLLSVKWHWFLCCRAPTLYISSPSSTVL